MDQRVVSQIIEAIQQDDYVLVSNLCQTGVDLNVLSDEYQITPLKTAIEFDNIQIALKLLEYGADPNTYYFGLTPLGQAVDLYCLMVQEDPEDNNLSMIKFLINHGASPKLLGSDGTSAIDVAIAYGCQDILDVLESI
ncbi:ankyrin repeat domain-containing protein [Deinococcus gobiensis]|uniref:Ankyrin repeat protein, putative n=1 Tax=Deinococcus gobiensis (strain DSM 21396 / JCM 16679 / CGMCC 1.7299 / I-0) TaxID=745776 RepID=H8H3Z5_DEIGI|nr:ankyrin repeat domain-containing protein [Deinococcus gobiensis]AFD28242.1 Ankyrin repeat protein, putative [Deinococcus gobiensis I-0]